MTALPLSKLILVTGKGGVGKTFVSFELARELASQGKKVALIESSIVAAQSRKLGLSFERHIWRKSKFGIHHINIDPRQNFADFIDDQLGKNKILKMVLNSAIVRSFLEVIPGLSDLLLLGRVCQEAASSPEGYDHVIFDGAASGHFYQLIATPSEIIRAEVVGPMLNKTKRLIEMLKDPSFCELRIVALAKDLVVQETREYCDKYKDLGYPRLSAVLLNRMTGLVEKDLGTLKEILNPPEKLVRFLSSTAASEQSALIALKQETQLEIIPVFEGLSSETRAFGG